MKTARQVRTHPTGQTIPNERKDHVQSNSLGPVQTPGTDRPISGALMKRLLLVLPVAVLALSACESASPVPASSGDRVIESTAVVPASPAVEPSKVEPYVPVDRTDAVLQSVAAGEGIYMPDGMASEYADIVCEGFDDGLSLTAMVRIAAQELPQWDMGEHAFLVGASIGAVCPEYEFLAGGA